jgi:hypothetical protein
MWPAASRSVSSRRAAPVDFANSGFWTLGLLGVAVAGFWQPYLSRIAVGVDVLTHVHAATVTAWLLLLASQALLIRQHRPAAHRVLGRLSYALMPVILGSAAALAVSRLLMARPDLPVARAELFFIQMGTTMLLATFYVLAMIHRRRPHRHARYMIGTALVMIDPIVARILTHVTPSWEFLASQVIWLVTVPILIVLIRLEPSGGRTRTPFVWQLMLLVLYQAATPVIGRSETWQSAVRWVVAQDRSVPAPSQGHRARPYQLSRAILPLSPAPQPTRPLFADAKVCSPVAPATTLQVRPPSLE